MYYPSTESNLLISKTFSTTSSYLYTILIYFAYMVFLNTIVCGLEPNYLEHLSFTFNTFYIVFNQGTLV